MEKIVRIQPYPHRKDRDYQPIFDFLKKVIIIIDSEFQFNDTLVDEFKDDKPYEYHTIIKKFGTKESGIEVIQEAVYEQVASGIAIDRVVVRAFGLKPGLEAEIKSIRNQEDSLFLELRIIASEEAVTTVVSQFYKKFESTPILQKKLRKELLILNTSLKRRAWYAVEMRAKSILKDFPGQPLALFAFSIARAAQGDLDARQELVKQVSQLKPDQEGIAHDLSDIQRKKEDNELALTELKQIIQPEPDNHPAHWMIDQAQKALEEIIEALRSYEESIQCE